MGESRRSASRAAVAAESRCPGLVDLQVNGFGGVDFASADAAGYRPRGRGALLEQRRHRPFSRR